MNLYVNFLILSVKDQTMPNILALEVLVWKFHYVIKCNKISYCIESRRLLRITLWENRESMTLIWSPVLKWLEAVSGKIEKTMVFKQLVIVELLRGWVVCALPLLVMRSRQGTYLNYNLGGLNLPRVNSLHRCFALDSKILSLKIV